MLFLLFLFSLAPYGAAVYFMPQSALLTGIYGVLMSLVTFCIWGTDKALAKLQRRRVPENFLFALGFCGGTPGAFAGMMIFRHKSAKNYFRYYLSAEVLFHGLAVGALYFLPRYL